MKNKKKSVAAVNRAKRLRERQQRWAKLAALWEKPYADRTPQERHATNFGICFSARETFRRAPRFADQMVWAIRDRFMPNDEAVIGSYLVPCRKFYVETFADAAHDAIRATLCAFFAIWGRKDREFFFNGVKA